MTQEELKAILHYEPTTGKFTWLVHRSNQIRAGSVAGTTHASGRRIIEIDGIQYKAAVLAWLYVYGAMPVKIIDHKDRDNSNDRIDNLREATKSQNNVNVGIRSAEAYKQETQKLFGEFAP